jgi:Xanthosine triphosphate pyrophosphatase
MSDIDNRRARFRCVIALIIDEKEYIFEGIINGQILRSPVGDFGFGYDSIFKADGYDVSFAQMTLDDKSEISHRGEAIKKLVEFLKK